MARSSLEMDIHTPEGQFEYNKHGRPAASFAWGVKTSLAGYTNLVTVFVHCPGSLVNRFVIQLFLLLILPIVFANAQNMTQPGQGEKPFLPYFPSLNPASMDRSVDPCVDFYHYSCGWWQKHNPIPPDHRRYLRGAKEQQPRWKRCVAYTDRNLGEALGQVYVAKVFSPEIKKEALDMTERIESWSKGSSNSIG